jgi:hypothetical protein
MILECILTLKKKLASKSTNIAHEYLKIVNLARIIFVYIIQLLYDNNLRLNNSIIQKFLILDSELDSLEPKSISEKILNYDLVRSKVDTTKRISKYLYITLDMREFSLD